MLEHFLQACTSLRIMVIGDLMVDRYLWGHVSRISPEAPVPVVDITSEENRLGGAANVALNLRELGAQVVLAGLLGDDEMGEALRSMSEGKGFDCDLLRVDPDRRTTVKIRVLGNRQQMLRLDKEDRHILSEELKQRFIESILKKVPEVDAIIFQDYDKGCLSEDLVQAVIQRANQQGIPSFVDPKKDRFFAFEHATFFKPNLRELNDGLGLQLEGSDLQAIQQAMLALKKKMPHQQCLITLSAHGMLLRNAQDQFTHFPAHPRSIADVSGAGDTVISVLALGIAAGLPATEAVRIANLAGGLVCEEAGVVPIRPDRLRKA
ncbi:MAG: bifunctional ADP-heptose synthase [Bacteroidota bacterium]